MAIKGAIFDMDGTLLDSMHVWIDIAGKYLTSKNINLTPNMENEIAGLMLKDLAEYFIKHFGFNMTVEEIIDDVNRLVENEYFYNVQIKPGTEDLLKELKRRNIPLCVATASDRYLVEAALKRVGIIDYFDKIFTCAEVDANKTSPDIYEHARAFLGTDKNETYVFEDTYTPIRTAKDAGFPVVAVADKWSAHRRDLIKKTADFFFDHPSELDIDAL